MGDRLFLATMNRRCVATASSVFALLFLASTTTAPLASAAPGYFAASSYPAHFVTSPIAEKSNSFTWNEEAYACSSTSYTGNLTEKSTQLTFEPAFSGCKVGELPATVTTNGCDYVLKAGEGTEAEFPVTADLECPSEKKLELHRYASAAKHTEGVSDCTLTAATQTGLEGLTYTKEAGTDAFLLEGTLELALQTHGACAFGFTINVTGFQHVNVTAAPTS